MSALAGAFAGKGLGETKEQRREAAEIAEIKALGAVPKWADASLLADLRRLSSAEASVKLAAAPVDIRQSIMNSKAIARLPAVEDGTNWAVLCKPIGQQECVICLGQDDGGKIQGAIAWWPARKGDVALRAADAVRCVLLDDSEHPPVTISHPTVQGVGENHTTPAPATSDLSAPVPLQLAESMRQFHVSRAQVNARLQRGGASADEKHHLKMLQQELHDRLDSYSMEAELPREALLQCESAVQGLRKSYLPREWESRCSFCGLRHSAVEKGTCKFWVKWAAEAKANAEAKATARPKAEAAAMATAEAAAAQEEEHAAAADEPAFTPFMPQLRKPHIDVN